MGSGRKPTPNVMLKLQDAYRKDRHGDRVDIESATPSCPSWVGDEGRKEWKRLTRLFKKQGILTHLDRGTLAMHVHAFDVFLEARDQVNANGLVVPGAKCPIQNPAVRIMNQAWEHYMRSAQEFGLTPVSRCKVTATKTKEVDELDSFISKKKKA